MSIKVLILILSVIIAVGIVGLSFYKPSNPIQETTETTTVSSISTSSPSSSMIGIETSAMITTTDYSNVKECKPIPEGAGDGIFPYALWINISKVGIPGLAPLMDCSEHKYYFSNAIIKISINGSLGNDTWIIDMSVKPHVMHEFLALNPDTLKPVSLGEYPFILHEYHVSSSSGNAVVKLYLPEDTSSWLEMGLCEILSDGFVVVGVGELEVNGYMAASYNYHAVPVQDNGKIYGDYATENFDEVLDAFFKISPVKLWVDYFPVDATPPCFTYPYAIWEQLVIIIRDIPPNTLQEIPSPEGEKIIVEHTEPFYMEIGGIKIPFYNITFKDYYTDINNENNLFVEGYIIASPYTTIPYMYKATFHQPTTKADVTITIKLIQATPQAYQD